MSEDTEKILIEMRRNNNLLVEVFKKLCEIKEELKK